MLYEKTCHNWVKFISNDHLQIYKTLQLYKQNIKTHKINKVIKVQSNKGLVGSLCSCHFGPGEMSHRYLCKSSHDNALESFVQA